MYIWMSLQAKCHRCGCTQPPSTFGWWLVACKSKQGIWEKNFENFLFRIFKTRFQSFLKTFWCFEKLFLKILQILILSNGTRHTHGQWKLRVCLIFHDLGYYFNFILKVMFIHNFPVNQQSFIPEHAVEG